jgi:hypothetical protein
VNFAATTRLLNYFCRGFAEVESSKLIAFLVIAPFLVSTGRTAIACSISDIKIKQAELVHNGHSSTVVGELINGCGEATGVQLHITLRDSAGGVISTDERISHVVRGQFVLKPTLDPIGSRRLMSTDVRRKLNLPRLGCVGVCTSGELRGQSF